MSGSDDGFSSSDIDFVAGITNDLSLQSAASELSKLRAVTESTSNNAAAFTAGTTYADSMLLATLSDLASRQTIWIEPSHALALQAWDPLEVMLVKIISPRATPREVAYSRGQSRSLQHAAQPVMKAFASPLADMYGHFMAFRAALQTTLDLFPEITSEADTPTLAEYARDPASLSPIALGTQRHTLIARLSHLACDALLALMARPTDENSSAIAFQSKTIRDFCTLAAQLTDDLNDVIYSVRRLQSILTAGQTVLSNTQILSVITENVNCGHQFNMRRYKTAGAPSPALHGPRACFRTAVWAPIATFIAEGQLVSQVIVNADMSDPSIMPEEDPRKSGPGFRPANLDTTTVKVARKKRVDQPRPAALTLSAYEREDAKYTRSIKPRRQKRKRSSYDGHSTKRAKPDQPLVQLTLPPSKYHRMSSLLSFGPSTLPVPFENGHPSAHAVSPTVGLGGSDCAVMGQSIIRCMRLAEAYMTCDATKLVAYHARNRAIAPLMNLLQAIIPSVALLRGFVIPIVGDGFATLLPATASQTERLRVVTYTENAQDPSAPILCTEAPLRFMPIQDVGSLTSVLAVMAATPHPRRPTATSTAGIARAFTAALLRAIAAMQRMTFTVQTAILEGFQRVMMSSHRDYEMDGQALQVISLRFHEILATMDNLWVAAHGNAADASSSLLGASVAMGAIVAQPNDTAYEEYMQLRNDALFLLQKLRPGAFGEPYRPLLTAEDLRVTGTDGGTYVQCCMELFGPMNLRNHGAIISDLSVCGVMPGTAAKGNAIQTKQEAYTREAKHKASVAVKTAAAKAAQQHAKAKLELGCVYGSSKWVELQKAARLKTAKKPQPQQRPVRGPSKKDLAVKKRNERCAALASGKMRQAPRNNGGGGGLSRRKAILDNQNKQPTVLFDTAVNLMKDIREASNRNGARRTKTNCRRANTLREKTLRHLADLHVSMQEFVVAIARDREFYGEELTSEILLSIHKNSQPVPDVVEEEEEEEEEAAAAPSHPSPPPPPVTPAMIPPSTPLAPSADLSAEQEVPGLFGMFGNMFSDLGADNLSYPHDELGIGGGDDDYDSADGDYDLFSLGNTLLLL